MLTQLKFMTGIKNPATDEPNVTIPFSSLTVTDGKVVIGEDVLKDIGYVKNIVLSCSILWFGKR